jgi:hypothetical protein
VPATLLQLLRCHCLHETPPPRLVPSQAPQTPLQSQPHAQQPEPATCNIIRAWPAFAATRSQRSCRRCTQRTAEVQLHQLLHPGETRCQRRCPITSEADLIACTHRHSSARPLQTAPPAAAQRANRPSPQHATSSAHSRRSQPPAHSAAAADASSVRKRFSIVSRVILPRLGASDAAPAASMSLPARNAAPSARPFASPPNPSTIPAPRTTARACNVQHHQGMAGVRSHPLTMQLQPMHAAYR